MTTDEWRAAVAARRPAPTAAQMAILKAARRSSEQPNAAPDRPSEAAPAITHDQERNDDAATAV